MFIYPDELVSTVLSSNGGRTCRLTNTELQKYSGSKRTFSALLKTMINKKKMALVLALMRRNASPTFCALLPQVKNPRWRAFVAPFLLITLQAEKIEEGGWNEPPGFHLIPLPFADDIRAASVEEAYRGTFKD